MAILHIEHSFDSGRLFAAVDIITFENHERPIEYDAELRSVERVRAHIRGVLNQVDIVIRASSDKNAVAKRVEFLSRIPKDAKRELAIFQEQGNGTQCRFAWLVEKMGEDIGCGLIAIALLGKSSPL